jgi:hypothetical protein
MKKTPIITAIVLILVAGAAAGIYWISNNISDKPVGTLSRPNPIEVDSFVVEKDLVREGGGYWHKRRETMPGEREKAMEKLRTLPYVTGSQEPAVETGVTVYDRKHAYNGYNLYSSAHAPEAYLCDMEGKVIHQWRLERKVAWPHRDEFDPDRPRHYFRRIHLFENGDMLGIYEYTGLVRIDAASNLLWAHQGWNHHDMFVDDEKIWVLGRDIDVTGHYAGSFRNAGELPPPRMVDGRRVYDENVTVLRLGGQLLDRFSLVECIQRSKYAFLLDKVHDFGEKEPIDLLHSNTVEILDGHLEKLSPFFKKGNLLTSFRNISTIAIIDPEIRQVVWAMSDAWMFQHDPRLLENGRMMVFDNYYRGLSLADSIPCSRVVEFDPFTRDIYWSYEGDETKPFFSSLMGTNQPLPNGNVLITESDFGRVIEVTRRGEIVWEFNSPHLSGEHNEFVATIPEMIRLAPDLPVSNIKVEYSLKKDAGQ